MPKNKGAKEKKAVKVKDLPARSLKGKDAAAVKGGAETVHLYLKSR